MVPVCVGRSGWRAGADALRRRRLGRCRCATRPFQYGAVGGVVPRRSHARLGELRQCRAVISDREYPLKPAAGHFRSTAWRTVHAKAAMPCSGSDAVLLEQRRDLRLAAAKLDEGLERIAAAAAREDAVEK